MKRRLVLVLALGLILISSVGIVGYIGAQEGQTAKQPVAARSLGEAAKPAGAAVAPVPLEVSLYPDRIFRSNGTLIYRADRDGGIRVSADGGATWTDRSEGLPTRAVWPFTTAKKARIIAVGIDAGDEKRLAVTLPDKLFLSPDAGITWRKIEVKDPVRPNDLLTSVALSSIHPDSFLLGTSFHGFFETRDAGATWTILSEKFNEIYHGSGSYEEVNSIGYHPSDEDLIWFSTGFGHGLYTWRRGEKSPVKVPFPGDQEKAPIVDFAFRAPPVSPVDAPAWFLEVRTTESRWTDSLADGKWTRGEGIAASVQPSAAHAERAAKASGKNGIYVSSLLASGDALDNHIAFCKKNGFNSMVVDFKDDYGIVAYDTALEAPRAIGAVRKRISTEEIVAKAHANGIYLIARIVVFRDKMLYNSSNYAYAVWNWSAKEPWRFLKKVVDEKTKEERWEQGEHWVDQYCEYVWKYNIDIARELQERGIDEIQFDYIRFPSDGDLSTLGWRYRKEGMGKTEALESFLAMARERISIPIGTDVYGTTGWYRIAGWVGQYLEMYADYVDVISPMFYPSHFPRDFFQGMEYFNRSEFLYQEGTRRSIAITGGQCVIRPYVQAFLIGGELNFDVAQYSAYLTRQLDGCRKGGASGCTLWNASNRYYMVTAPLQAYLGGGTQ